MRAKLFLSILTTIISVQVHAKTFSQIDGTRSNLADPRNHDVYFVSIDGKKNDRRIVDLSPGTHVIYIASSKGNRIGAVKASKYPLYLKPCVRYFLSAQHPEKGRRDRWELKVDEEKIVSCELPEEKESDINIEQDPRVNNFQAEIHAVAMRDFLLEKLDKCPKLNSDQRVLDWINNNLEIVESADYNLKSFVAVRAFHANDDVLRRLYFGVVELLRREKQRIKSFNKSDNCEVSDQVLENLMDKWPYSEVYRSLPDPSDASETHYEWWNKVLQAVNNED